MEGCSCLFNVGSGGSFDGYPVLSSIQWSRNVHFLHTKFYMCE